MKRQLITNCNNSKFILNSEFKAGIQCIMHPAGETLNGVTYSEQVLKLSASKWNNIRCYFDHSSEERSVRDIAGHFANVHWDENEKAICGTLELLDHPDCEKIKSGIKRMLESDIKLFALSSVNYVELDQNSYDKGKLVVNNIEEVESVDLVTRPATDARFTSYNSINAERLNPMLRETKLDANGLPIVDETPVVPTTPMVDVNAVNKTNVKAANMLTLMNAAYEYNLNPSTKDRVLNSFKNVDDRLITVEEVTKKIEDYNSLVDDIKKEYAKEYSIPKPAEVTQDSYDKHVAAIDGFFAQKDVNNVPRYTSIRELYVDLTGDKYITGLVKSSAKSSLMKQFASYRDENSIMSDDLALTLGNFMNRALVAEYSKASLMFGNWRAIADIVPLKDFKPQYRMRFGGYADLPKVAQGADYVGLGEVSEETMNYTAEKRGGTEDITLETIMNDDVGVVRRLPMKMAQAAERTLHKFVFELLFANPTIYDSAALFADRSSTLGDTNKGTAAVNYTGTATMTIETIKAGRVAMMKYPELNNKERLGIEPRYLIAPPDLTDAAMGLLKSEFYPRLDGTSGTGNFQPSIPNYNNGWGLDVLPYKLGTSTTKWMLIADKDMVPTLEVGFIGSEQPSIVVQDRPDSGSMFNADKITYKIYHFYGGGVRDWRGVYGYGF